MEVTLESVEKNKGIYNENIKKIMEQRAELMKQVSELRRKRESLTDEIDIAKLDFEESKLVQQINDLTAVFKGNKLTLEQLGLQEDILQSKIDRETYSKGMVANRKAKADLSKEQELTYCENEVIKCQKALKLYTMIGDNESIIKWQKALENAQKSLEYAKQEMGKEQETPAEKDNHQQSQEPYINEYGEIIRPDNSREEVPTDEHQAGYSREEKDGVITEGWNQALKDSSGKEIGKRTITDTSEIGTGKRTVETVGEIENDDGKYTMREISIGDGDDLSIQKQMNRDNKITGEKEEFAYKKDKRSEVYSKKTNGQMSFKVTKTEKGITIDEYRNGQPYATYEYDENGKAIDGMGMADMEQLDENYVENFFDSQVPYFEAEGVDKSTPAKEMENEDILKSAVEATEETTRTSTINEQVQNIRNVQREKTQQQNKENTGIDR